MDIYSQPKKKISVLCHTSLGDPNDPFGRFFVKGNEYILQTEITRISSNNQECILCWINFNDKFGSRFSVKGNIYRLGEPYWPHFTKYFICPIERNRDNKINKIISRIQ